MKKIQIHVIKYDMNIDFLQKRFQEEDIKFDIQVDNPIRNRPYPYCTLNDNIVCTKRLILMKRNGELD